FLLCAASSICYKSSKKHRLIENIDDICLDIAMYTIGSIIQAVPTQKMSINYPDAEIQRLEYDSRRLAKGEESLFFALHGGRDWACDGRTLIRDIFMQGVRNCLLSDLAIDVSDVQECKFS